MKCFDYSFYIKKLPQIYDLKKPFIFFKSHSVCRAEQGWFVHAPWWLWLQREAQSLEQFQSWLLESLKTQCHKVCPKAEMTKRSEHLNLAPICSLNFTAYIGLLEFLQGISVLVPSTNGPVNKVQVASYGRASTVIHRA